MPLAEPTRVRARVRARAQWLLSLCVALLALFAPRAALADAPLCDPSGASVAAPAPVLPNATGELVAPKSCDGSVKEILDVGQPNPDRPAVVRGMDVPDRVIATPGSLPRVLSKRLPRAERSQTLRLPGFAEPVYRPPAL
ncbi:MAG TPA: hypothetical protein VHE30_30280 [Polyangiaceae bacterium]|nr:hypothetical protein [Polyangiaceae bacterium]